MKLVVIYPCPGDVATFERVYQNGHVPQAAAKLIGKTRMMGTRVLGSPQGAPPFYRIVEIHFSSMAALEACAASNAGKETLAHAVQMSSGGPPIFLVAKEESSAFPESVTAG